MIEAMKAELRAKEARVSAQPIRTIYFGGGTPSLLTATELDSLLQEVFRIGSVTADVEITLEANPDDITPDKLEIWGAKGINRLSIGIQSFDDADLRLMNRAHDSREASTCVALAKESGFDNITVDMIYGLPSADMGHFEENLKRFIELDVDHISAYNLTIEQGTLFSHLLKKGEISLPAEEAMAARFVRLRNQLADSGYEQYEVSNFARNGRISRHNSAYWLRRHYTGIGPSAHSYDGVSRSWNVANNGQYMKAIEVGSPYEEREELSQDEQLNDYILTRLRTKWGIDLDEIQSDFGVNLRERCAVELKRYSSYYTIENQVLTLNSEGLLRADGIASDLFLVG